MSTRKRKGEREAERVEAEKAAHENVLAKTFPLQNLVEFVIQACCGGSYGSLQIVDWQTGKTLVLVRRCLLSLLRNVHTRILVACSG